MIDQRERYERAFERFEPDAGGLERLISYRDRRRRRRQVAAGVVGIAVFIGAIWLVTSRGPSDRGQQLVPGGAGTGPSATGPPEPTVATRSSDIVGLPLVGAPPSTPEHGRLLLYLEGNVGGPATAVWVYADGRVIWGDQSGIFPPGAPTEGATGFVEQHLTPSGVELLRTQVVATGLFEHNLELLIDRAGFLTVEARNGGRLVQVTWAWDGIVGKDAPSATSEEATALEGIVSLLTRPGSWPASVWEDEDPMTFVPSRYQVWLRVFPDQGDGPSSRVGEREVGLLPLPASDILRSGVEVRPETWELKTDDLRAFARALNRAGLEPWSSPMGEGILRYTLEDPYEPGSSLWVFIGPVLPHGEAVFLGPG